jgi:hypothetical protein
VRNKRLKSLENRAPPGGSFVHVTKRGLEIGRRRREASNWKIHY